MQRLATRIRQKSKKFRAMKIKTQTAYKVYTYIKQYHTFRRSNQVAVVTHT